MMISVVMMLATLGADKPIILDNGLIRVEAEPRLFGFRFIGFPGGQNFVEPLHVSDLELAGKSWLDPGGLVTDILPAPERDAAVRRGPAEVLAQDAYTLIMLSPVSPTSNIQVKKELQLTRDKAEARYRVSVMTPSSKKWPYYVRNTVRIPMRSTLRLEKGDDILRPLSGTKLLAPWVVKSMEYWSVPIPPTQHAKQVVLGGFLDMMRLEGRDGVWERRIVGMPPSGRDVESGSTFVCVLDDETRGYGAAFQGAKEDLDPGSPMVFTEEWIFERRGRE